MPNAPPGRYRVRPPKGEVKLVETTCVDTNALWKGKLLVQSFGFSLLLEIRLVSQTFFQILLLFLSELEFQRRSDRLR